MTVDTWLFLLNVAARLLYINSTCSALYGEKMFNAVPINYHSDSEIT